MVLAVLLVVSTCAVGVFAVSEEDEEIVDTPEVVVPNATGADVDIEEIPEYDAVAIPETAIAIDTAAEFLNMAPNGVYYLASDLTLDSSYGTAIAEGEEPTAFSGQLFGNGKTVTVSAPMFELVKNAFICDLTIEGEIVTTDPALYTGAVTRRAEGITAQSITNDATVTGILATGSIVGQLKDTSTFTNCVNNGAITANYFLSESGSYTLGEAAGFVGSLSDNTDALTVTFKDCVNNGAITAYCNVAGLLGWTGSNGYTNQTLVLNHCANTGDITQLATPKGDNGYRAGGLLGTVYSSRVYIDSCANFGNVTNEVNIAAGIVGWHKAKDGDLRVTNSLNMGAISAKKGDTVLNKDAGGILGNFEPSSSSFGTMTFDNCYNGGAVEGGRIGGIYGAISNNSWMKETKLLNCTNDAPINSVNYCGGIAGRIDGVANAVIKNCVNTENGTVTATSYCGGLIGYVEQVKGLLTVENCRNDGTVTAPGSVAGILSNISDTCTATLEMTDCVNNGDIVCTDNTNGGICGGLTGGGSNKYARATFKNCFNFGDVTARYCGGIVGRCASNRFGVYYEGCYNFGTIKGHNLDSDKGRFSCAGGITGHCSTETVNKSSTDTTKVEVNYNPMISFIDCHNFGEIISDYAEGDNAGGICAALAARNGYFENCTNNAPVTSTKAGQTGGIIGSFNAYGTQNYAGLGCLTVTGCVNNGEISAGTANPCGIVSWSKADKIVISDCLNTVDITATNGGQKSSGIASRVETKSLTVTNCVNIGNITGNSEIGGIVGYNAYGDGAQNIVKNCVQIGDVKSVGATPAGGIYGKALDGNFFAYNCVSIGNVSNTGSGSVGGILGNKGNHDNGYHEFNSCLVVGSVTTGNENHSIGGIVGYMNCNENAGPSILNCAVYADITGGADVSALAGYFNGGMQSNYMMNNLFVGTLNRGTAAADAENQYRTLLAVHSGNKWFPTANILNNYYFGDIEYLQTGNDHALAELDDEVNFQMESATQDVTAGLGNAWVYIAEEDAIVVNETVSISGNLPAAAVEVLKNVLGLEADAPIAINTAEEFANMDPDGDYYLAADLTLTESYKYIFTGTLDGNDKTITTSAPIFGAVEGAEISNLTIEGSLFDDCTAIGALARTADGIVITNVVNNAEISNVMIDTSKDVLVTATGGFVGFATGKIVVTDSNNGAALKASDVGGFFGRIENGNVLFTNCYNLGAISAFSSAAQGGGFIGSTGEGTFEFENCVNSGIIMFTTATKYTTQAGGFIGRMHPLNVSVKLTDCVNAGNVLGGDQTGGFVGTTQGTVEAVRCVNLGNVFSWNNYAGGIVGRADRICYFEDCLNFGDVVGSRQYAGGIIGYAPNRAQDSGALSYYYKNCDELFLRCANFGDVHGNYERIRNEGKSSAYWFNVGGIAGTIMAGDLLFCVSIGTVAGNQSVGGLVGSFANGNTMDGRYVIHGCYVEGTIYSTGAKYSDVKNDKGEVTGTKYAEDKSYGVGGLFGYANGGGGSLPYAFDNVVNAHLSVDSPVVTDSITNQPLVAGIAGYYNIGGGSFQNNVFLGSLKSYNVKKYATVWSQNGSVNHSGNYVDVVGGDCFAFRKGGTDMKMADYGAYIIGENTLLPTDLVKVGDALMDEELVAIYNLKDADASDFVPEDAAPTVPVVPMPPVPETTTEPDAETTLEPDAETTTEPDAETTTEPDAETTTEPDVETTTEPDGDVTTAEPDDVTTAGDTTEEQDGGCGSVIGASIALVAMAIVAPAALMLKKRED